MHRQRRGHIFSVQLQIGNTDPQLMLWIQRHFNGSLNLERRHNAKHQDVWRWLATSARFTGDRKRD